MKGKFSDDSTFNGIPNNQGSNNESIIILTCGNPDGRGNYSANDGVFTVSSTVKLLDRDTSAKVKKAVDQDNVGYLHQLVEEEAHPYCAEPDVFNGRHAINHAALQDKMKVLKYLVEELKVDPLTTDDCCQPIHWAIMGGSLSALQYLIDQGADIEAKSKKLTPLKYAA